MEILKWKDGKQGAVAMYKAITNRVINNDGHTIAHVFCAGGAVDEWFARVSARRSRVNEDSASLARLSTHNIPYTAQPSPSRRYTAVVERIERHICSRPVPRHVRHCKVVFLRRAQWHMSLLRMRQSTARQHRPRSQQTRSCTLACCACAMSSLLDSIPRSSCQPQR